MCVRARLQMLWARFYVCAGSRQDGYHASTEGALALVMLAMTGAGEEVQATTIGAKGDARAVCVRACVRARGSLGAKGGCAPAQCCRKLGVGTQAKEPNVCAHCFLGRACWGPCWDIGTCAVGASEVPHAPSRHAQAHGKVDRSPAGCRELECVRVWCEENKTADTCSLSVGCVHFCCLSKPSKQRKVHCQHKGIHPLLRWVSTAEPNRTNAQTSQPRFYDMRRVLTTP